MSPAKKYYKPRPPQWRSCACGCGQVMKGTARRLYVDATHRQRAHRNKPKP